MTTMFKNLDEAWSRAVKKGKCRCELCGKRAILDAHHVFSRRNMSVRWELKNGIALCRSCHLKAHSSPKDFRKCLALIRGEIRVSDLEIEAKTVKVWNDDLLASKLKELKNVQ